MKSHFPYYGVAGMKGYAVYDNYNLALKNRACFSKDNLKGFYSFEEAKEWCEEYYYRNNYAMATFVDYGIIDEIKEVNRNYKRTWGHCMVGIRVENRHRCPCKDITEIVEI